MKMFIWLLLKGRLLVREKLVRLNLLNNHENLYPLCGQAREDLAHLFILYREVSLLWYTIAFFWEVPIVLHNSILGLFDYWFYSSLPIININAW